MSNLTRPVGPLPPRVYWMRRFVVLAVALVVVILIGTIIGKVAGSGSAAEKTNAGQEPSPGASESKQPAGLPVDCAKAELGLSLGANGSRFVAGQNLTFAVDVKNVGEAPCLADVNAETLAIDIVSGKDEIWSSARCVEAEPELLLLEPGDVQSVSTNWDRMRNDSKCSEKNAEAKAGTYRASAHLAGASSEELVFTLE